LRSRNYINVVVAAKNEMPQWLSAEQAFEHRAKGIDVWPWAGSNAGDANVILAACGDVPTLEILAAAQLLRERVPSLNIRVVNVLDLMKLAAPHDHPHGLSDASFEALFGLATPVVMAFHGYPRVVHELIHHRPDPARFHVRGYEEEGATTTPFDMVVRNRMSRYHLAAEAVRRCGEASAEGAALLAYCADRLNAHARYIVENGVDLPEVANWQWM
jgi:xylulose-5-phosphate/fructose-6-phosphate phosphoketolase